jgi:hypothetical protein
MSKEEFRLKMLQKQFGTPLDIEITNCFYLLKEGLVKNVDEIFEMPTSRFDILVEELIKHYKREEEAMKSGHPGRAVTWRG